MSLLDQSTQTSNIDKSFFKVIAVGVVGVLLAAVCGYFLEDILGGALDLLPLILSSIGFFAVFLLQVFYVKSFRYLAIITLLESIAITSMFLNKYSGSLLLAWVLLFIWWLFAVSRGRTEINNQLQLKFTRIEKLVSPQAFTAFALFISIVTVWVNGATLSKERFLSLMRPAQPIFQSFLSQSFTFDMTISKFVEVMLQSKTGINISGLPTAAKNMAIDEAISQLKTQYNIPIKATDTFNDVIYNYLMQLLERIPQPVKIVIPISAMLLVFFTVKSITMVLRYFIMLLAYILYEVALLTGFSKKALESRSHEVITL